jgi:hypothetical protein
MCLVDYTRSALFCDRLERCNCAQSQYQPFSIHRSYTVAKPRTRMSDPSFHRPTSASSSGGGGFSRHLMQAGALPRSTVATTNNHSGPSGGPPASSTAASTGSASSASAASKSSYTPAAPASSLLGRKLSGSPIHTSTSASAATTTPPHFERQPPPTITSAYVPASASPFLLSSSGGSAAAISSSVTRDPAVSHVSHAVRMPRDTPKAPPRPSHVGVGASSHHHLSKWNSSPSPPASGSPLVAAASGDVADLHAAEQSMLDDIGLFRQPRTSAQVTVESLLRDKRREREAAEKDEEKRLQKLQASPSASPEPPSSSRHEKLDRERLAKTRAKDMATIHSILAPPTASSGGRSSPTTSQSALDMSLITSLTQRLSTLERIASKQAKSLGQKDVIISDLQFKVRSMTQSQDAQLLYELQKEAQQQQTAAEALRKQVTEMESFLNDYGLVWCGFRAEHTGSEAGTVDGSSPVPQHQHSSTQVDDSTVSASPRDPTASPSEAASPSPEPAASVLSSTIYFDVGSFLASVSELNSIATEGQNLRIHTTSSGVTKFLPPASLDLLLYKNGMFFRNGPLRSWASKEARDFIRDVEEGFFPYELKEEYPDGVCLAVIDRSKYICPDRTTGAVSLLSSSTAARMEEDGRAKFTAFAGKGMRLEDGKVVEGPTATAGTSTTNVASSTPSASPKLTSSTAASLPPPSLPLSTFLAALPAQTILPSGKVVEVRGEVQKMLKGGEGRSEQQSTAASRGSPPPSSGVSASPSPPAPSVVVTPILIDTPVLRLLQAREAAALAADPSTSAAAAASLPALPSFTTLQVKLDPSDRSPPLLMKMRADDQVRMIREFVDREREKNGGSNPPYELRSTYPARHYALEDKRTLLEAGMVPNASLFIRNARPHSGYRQRSEQPKPDESWSTFPASPSAPPAVPAPACPGTPTVRALS